MKKIVMVGPKQSKVIDVDVPKITDDEVLVKVRYTGMCHSEWYPWSVAKPGDEFGHESMGFVAEVGRNVTGFSVGDRVTGLGGGGYKEYIVMKPEQMMHVPENIADEDAVVEPIGCMMSAGTKMLPRWLGDEIAVVGAGYMGLGMISMFRALGYHNIVAVDVRDEALANAMKYGASSAIHPEELPRDRRLDWETWESPDLRRDGHKMDIFNTGFQNVMEFAGTPSALELAGRMTSAHGRLGIGGYHNDSFRNVDFKLWNMKALHITNCHERRIPFEAQLCHHALDMIASGQWKFTGLTTHIYGMEEFDKGNYDMESHAGNFIKGVVKCD